MIRFKFHWTQGNLCSLRFTGELVWLLCLRHSLMSLSRNHSQKCVYSLGQHLFGMYFETKQGLILGCSVFGNTIQWKVSLESLGLPLLLFRIREFIHNSSSTFPEGFFNISEISKIVRKIKTWRSEFLMLTTFLEENT